MRTHSLGAGNFRPTDAGHRAMRNPVHGGCSVLALVALLLSLYCFAAWSPPHFGDDIDYLSTSEAFIRHGTPDVTVQDFKALAARNPQDPVIGHLSRIIAPQLRNGEDYFGFYKDASGRFYSYHFWLYSLINAPALALCQIFNIPARNAFLVTNAELFLVLTALIVFGSGWRFRRKLLLVALALGCGTTFYLRASVPESMCFCLLIGGLLLLETRRFVWALFAFAVAAQQNPPIGFLAAIAGCLAAWQFIAQWRHSDRGWSRRQSCIVAAMLFGGLLLLASPVFYCVHFGVPSLIIAHGNTHAFLISWRRMTSLFFDWNQGMFLAMPVVFLMSLVLLVLPGGAKNGREKWMAAGLIALLLTMAIPALTQVNWNSGDAIISRYAYWLSALLIYACALLMDALLRARSFVIGSSALLLSQVGVLFACGVQGMAYSYTEPGPIAAWLLNNRPAWYHPLPEIFVERGMHTEGVLRPDYSYFHVRNGYLNLALSRTKPILAIEMLCRVNQGRLDSEATEQGWRYLRLKRYCPLDWPDGLYAWPDAPPLLQASNNMVSIARYLGNMSPGFDKADKSGTWTTARFAAMPLLVPLGAGAASRKPWRITLAFWPNISPPAIPAQEVSVSVNRRNVLQLRYTQSRPEVMSFVAEPQRIGTIGAFLLEFRIPMAMSPKQLGLSADPRQMGIKLTDVRAAPR